MTAQGFRSLASTLLNELGWPPDAIERQLAHIEENETRSAYNYAEHLPIRRKMMQWWADYLDGLRDNVRRTADTQLIMVPDFTLAAPVPREGRSAQDASSAQTTDTVSG
jgi:hypothetical protein